MAHKVSGEIFQDYFPDFTVPIILRGIFGLNVYI